MAELLLHLAELGAGPEKMGREGVADGVGGECAGDPRLLGVPLDQQPEALSGQAVAAVIQEERVCGLTVKKHLAGGRQIDGQGVTCDVVELEDALAAAASDTA